MRYKAIGFVITALFASVANGQPPVEENLDRVLHFTATERVQDLQEIATVVRSISETRHVAGDTAQRSLRLQGTAAQIALAEWLFNELDKSTDRQAVSQRSQGSAPPELRLSGSDDVVRVFYLTNTETAQDLREISTLVRSMTEVRKQFTYSPARALTLRGTAAQIAFAEWLFNELDKPTDRQAAAQGSQDSTTHELRLPGSDDVVRVFHLANTDTPEGIQEIASQVRSITEVFDEHSFAIHKEPSRFEERPPRLRSRIG